MDRIRHNVRVARILVGISLGWVLLTFGCLISSYFDIGNPTIPIPIRLASGGCVLVVGAISIILHLIALWSTKKGDMPSRLSRLLLILSTLGIVLIAILTGFSIVPLLYPSAILLSVSSLLSFIG